MARADHTKTRKVVEIENRRRKVASNIAAGLNYRAMAEALNVSIGTIASDVKALLKQWQKEQLPDTESYVVAELQVLGRVQNAIWGKVTDGDLGAVDRLLRIMDQRAKYLGLYQPEKIAPTDPTGKREYAQLTDAEVAAKLATLFGHGGARGQAGDAQSSAEAGTSASAE